MARVFEKWYHEGAAPVWKVQCTTCDRIYHIMETQDFICDCLKEQINITTTIKNRNGDKK
jgi:hypothetical protein